MQMKIDVVESQNGMKIHCLSNDDGAPVTIEQMNEYTEQLKVNDDWIKKAAAEIVGKRLRLDHHIEDAIRKHHDDRIERLSRLLREARVCIDELVDALKKHAA